MAAVADPLAKTAVLTRYHHLIDLDADPAAVDDAPVPNPALTTLGRRCTRAPVAYLAERPRTPSRLPGSAVGCIADAHRAAC